MNIIPKLLLGAAVCVGSSSLSIALVNAAPAIGQVRVADPAALTPNLVVQVQNRGRLQGGRHYSGRHFSGRHYGYGGNRFYRHGGRNVALGIGAVIIGGVVLSQAARAEHRISHGSDWQRCEYTYRSFESDTGMYTGHDGIRRPCPYLS